MVGELQAAVKAACFKQRKSVSLTGLGCVDEVLAPLMRLTVPLPVGIAEALLAAHMVQTALVHGEAGRSALLFAAYDASGQSTTIYLHSTDNVHGGDPELWSLLPSALQCRSCRLALAAGPAAASSPGTAVHSMQVVLWATTRVLSGQGPGARLAPSAWRAMMQLVCTHPASLLVQGRERNMLHSSSAAPLFPHAVAASPSVAELDEGGEGAFEDADPLTQWQVYAAAAPRFKQEFVQAASKGYAESGAQGSSVASAFIKIRAQLSPNTELREYQKQGLKWMFARESRGVGEAIVPQQALAPTFVRVAWPLYRWSAVQLSISSPLSTATAHPHLAEALQQGGILQLYLCMHTGWVEIQPPPSSTQASGGWGGGGILADEMGLGKTLLALALCRTPVHPSTPLAARHGEAASLWSCLAGGGAAEQQRRAALCAAAATWPHAANQDATGIAARKTTRKSVWQIRSVRLKLDGAPLLLRPRALLPSGWRPATAGSAGSKCAVTGLTSNGTVSGLNRFQQCASCRRHVLGMAVPCYDSAAVPVCLACHGHIAQNSVSAVNELQHMAQAMSGEASDSPASPKAGQQVLLPSAATLIVCPDQLLSQWAGEMHKHYARVHIHDLFSASAHATATEAGAAQCVQVAVYPGVSAYFRHCSTLQRSDTARSKEAISPALCMSPVFLSTCDIVLTTYSALQKDLLRDPSNTRVGVLSTPLLQMHWHRVILDEAQMVDVPTSRSAKMARLLACNHRWGMSGTPLLRGVEDFRGLCQFLGLQPFDSAAALQSLTAPSSTAAVVAATWMQQQPGLGQLPPAVQHDTGSPQAATATSAGESLDVQQYALEEHFKQARPDQLALIPGGTAGLWPLVPPAHRFLSCVSDVMWRNTQADVLQQLDLPDRYEETILVRLFPAEQQAYERLFREAQRRVAGVIQRWRAEGAADAQSLQTQLTSSEAGGLLGEALLQVRQMACHVSATSGVNWLRGGGAGSRRGKAPSALDDAMTQEELVDSLVEKARNDCEQAQREWAYALNGLAGLACIYGDGQGARGRYGQVLQVAAERSEKYGYRLDAGQTVHALQNLRRLSSGQDAAAPPAGSSGASQAPDADVTAQVQAAAQQYAGERLARVQQALQEVLALALQGFWMVRSVGGTNSKGPAQAKRLLQGAVSMWNQGDIPPQVQSVTNWASQRTGGEDITGGHSLSIVQAALLAAPALHAEVEEAVARQPRVTAAEVRPQMDHAQVVLDLAGGAHLAAGLCAHASRLLQACLGADSPAALEGRLAAAQQDAKQRSDIKAARLKRDTRLDVLEAAAASGAASAAAELAAAQERAEAAAQREELVLSAVQPPHIQLAQALVCTATSVGALPAYVRGLTTWPKPPDGTLPTHMVRSLQQLQEARAAAYMATAMFLTPSSAELAAAGQCEQCRAGSPSGSLCSMCSHRRSLEAYRACFWVRNSDDGTADKRIRPSSVQTMASLGGTGGSLQELVAGLASGKGKRRRTKVQQGQLGIAAGDVQTDTALVRVARHLAGSREGMRFYSGAAQGAQGRIPVTLPRVLEALQEEAEGLLVLWQHGKDFLSSVDEFSQFSLRMSLVVPDVADVPVVLSGNVPFQELPEELVLPSTLPQLQGVQAAADASRPHGKPLPAVEGEGALLTKAAATAIPSNYLWPWDITAREAHFQDTLQAAEADLRTFNYRLLHTQQLKRDLRSALGSAAPHAGHAAAHAAPALHSNHSWQSSPECPICLQDIFKMALCVLPCAHKLCRQCTKTALRMHSGSYKCPLCKMPFTRQQVTLIDTAKAVSSSSSPAAPANQQEGGPSAGAPPLAAAQAAPPLSQRIATPPSQQQHPTHDCRLLRKGQWQSVPPTAMSASAALVAAQLGHGSSDLLRGSIVGSSALGGKLSSIVYFVQQLVHTAASTGAYCRLLIFSQWDVLLRILGSGLEANGVPCARVTGAKDLPSTLTMWQQSSTHPALLLPTRVGNSGLNITEANHVVFVEPLMTGSVEAQAVGRVHRGGQSRVTHVHRFVTSGTVEPAVAIACSGRTASGRGAAMTREQAIKVLASDLQAIHKRAE